MLTSLKLIACSSLVFMMSLSAQALASGALVINDQGCGLLDGNGGGVSADSDHAVVTPSGNGVLKCKVAGVSNSTGKAVQWSFANTGYSCSTPAGSTTDWHETVSADGNATLTCHVH